MQLEYLLTSFMPTAKVAHYSSIEQNQVDLPTVLQLDDYTGEKS